MAPTATRRPPQVATGAARAWSGPWLTMPRLWLVVVLGAIGVRQLAQLPGAVDLAYHLKVGQLMVAEHAVPRTDVLAWTTAGRPWLDQNWGAQLVLYGIWRLGGLPLLTVVGAALTVASWALVAAACRRRTADLRLVAGAVLAGYAVSAAAFSVRPELFSLLLFAVELYLLEAARARPRVALAIPLLMPLWANLHGAFVVGIGLLVIEVLAAAWRRDRSGTVRYLLVTVAGIAGLLVNPWGVRVLGYAVSLPTNQVVTRIVSEWGPTSPRHLTGVLALGALGLLVVALVRAPAPGRVPEQLLRMAVLGGLALWAVRGVAWFGLALPIALCALARERPPRPAVDDRGTPAVSVLVLAVLAVALVAAAPPLGRALFGPRPEMTYAPVAAADWLAANPQPGRMLNFQPWGSYLELRLGPEVQVAFDSRIELPPADRWDRYQAVLTGRWDTERLLDDWGVGHVVLSRRSAPALVELLERSGRWRVAFASGDQRVYVRG
ncbi:MAG TPA: hypothetical protein VJB61_03575 [Actinomycetota bacterium]